jgi:predicted nucleic acid-binding protein
VAQRVLAAPSRTETFLDKFCDEPGITVEWEISEKIWRAAGAALQGYAGRRRKQTGAEPRRILTDFLIGAHASVNGYQLLVLDEGTYRTAFPRLAIVAV